MESLSKERLWDSGIIWGPWELKEGNRQDKNKLKDGGYKSWQMIECRVQSLQTGD